MTPIEPRIKLNSHKLPGSDTSHTCLCQLRRAERRRVLVPKPVAVPEAAELFHEEAPHGRADPSPGDGLFHDAAHPDVDVARVPVDAGETVQHLLVLGKQEEKLYYYLLFTECSISSGNLVGLTLISSHHSHSVFALSAKAD